ncbi:unnamed protein product [Notodromas monacha]|uniref:Peroxin/Ferlin domain-containing protein n=1 Tax=Notodromas monacha TaxID=399045 RepID=A0A7R9BH23_9CRUS|nr:unnamed protein product [Notodromas monacha]CAG0914640.1 unnamed protein product [Notodromas monacha]
MCSYLYGVDTTGRLVRLSTSESEWKELPYLGVDFKRLSAHAGFVWAIGGDHQVYLYVNHRDAYIRVKEDSYENQRWNPVEGFSGNLLPTDRCAFSNSDGTIQRKKDEVRLPSLAWEWEGNWEIEDNLRGTVLDSGSWTYAVDFPRSYGPKKTWNSMVRRRKWYRYRRYVAVDSWALIENVSKDPTEEPFIDIAIGGSDMPAGNADEISVWGVTVRGRVMFRKNVLETNPEGSSWIHVPSPTNLEACQISVGPTGLTWAVCWDEGRAIVRTGINRNCRMGKSWEIVEPPEGGVKLECVSVGFDCVWAVDRQKQVWFRRGINGLQAGERNEAAVGTGWLEMVGNLAMVSIGANNQAFGLGPPEDRRLFLRTGIAGSDTSGKAWSEIQALIRNRSRTESTSSLTTSISSRGHVPSLSSMRQTYSTESSPSTLRRSPTTFSRSLDSANVICTEKVRETVTKLMSASSMEEKTEDVKDSGLTSVIRQESSSESFLSANESDKSSVDGVDLSAKPVNNVVIDFVGHAEAEANDEGDGDASQSRAGASLDPLEPQMSSLSLEASSIMSTSKNSLLPMGDDFHFDSYEMGVPELEGRLVLTSISAGDCRIDPHNLPPWFSNLQRNASNESDEPWKAEIVENLERRRERETRDFKHFNEAVDRKSWVKTTKGFCLREPSTWLRASIELETSGSSQRLIDGGLLTVYPSNEKAVAIVQEF